MWMLLLSLLAPLQGQDQPAQEPEHPHHHDERFLTDRDSPVRLALPLEEDAFSFAIFGDRTGGPADGVICATSFGIAAATGLMRVASDQHDRRIGERHQSTIFATDQ